MGKIYLIGDIHIGLGYPNSTDKWSKIHKQYFNDFLIPTLKSRIKDGDIIVQLGDLFDNRNIIPIDLLNYGIDIVEEISKIAPFHIIVGNHDLWSKSSSEINSVRPLRYIPNVKIYSSVEKIEYDGKSILMMPYIDKKSDQIKAIENNKDCDYLFCHSDLNGCKMHLTSIANKNLDKIDIENFKYFSKVMSGHIHLVQTNKQFTFVGSIFQMDRNDLGDQKGIFVLDTLNNVEFIPNNISPIFKKIKITNESDIDQLDTLKDTQDYIDLSISNNLLISNRKLRRKLEVMLEKGNFASIEYIDDITKELIDDENINESIIIDENGKEITIHLEYDVYIKDYILNQKYSNDKFKSGVISEFDDIIKIYNENYKKID